MELEGCVDVVTTLQRHREQRPGILTSQVMKGGSREEGRIGRKEGRNEGRGKRGKDKINEKKRRKREGNERRKKADFHFPLFKPFNN